MTISIHTVLRNLIDEKSKRDNIEFTAYQLARALDMPRSLITSLTHSDESKRVVNPRISTLLKIVDFFRADGFDIKIEDLLGLNTNTIDITQEQPATNDRSLITIPVYSLTNEKLGTIDLNITNTATNVIAVHINEEIPPFFKIGSIFIIDKDLSPENDNLVAVTLNNPERILIKKYLYSKGKTYLQSLDKQENIVVMPTMQLKIIGVIIQVNAKT